jgi:hypothetical protein
MSMDLREKLRIFAGGLLLAFMAAFAPAAAPSAEPAAQAQASSTSGHSDLSKASLPGGAVPEHAVLCFEQHDPCSPGGIAPAPAATVALDAMPGTGLVKAPALLPVPMPDVAPHAAASLTILFRNFRE